MSAGAPGGQRRDSDSGSCKLELQELGKQPTLVLGSKLKSPGKSRKFSTTEFPLHPLTDLAIFGLVWFGF